MKKLIQTFFFFLLITQICFAQGTWTQIGDMPEIRYAHTVNELDGKIYVVGGLNTETGVSPRTALVYDRSSGVWTQIPLCNNKIRGAHTSCIVDGKLYVIGGNDSSTTLSTMDMFDPDSGQWIPKNSMPTDRGLLACASIDGKIYVMGGLRIVGGGFDYGGLKTMEMYDVTTETWSQLPDMPTKRWGHSAVAYNGKIYVFGGVTFFPTTVYNTVEVYNPQDSTWTTKSGIMPTARYCLTACSLDNKMYAIGGWYHSDYGPLYDKVEVYNPESDTWYTETPMPVACAVLASIVLDGKIYLYGGTCVTHPLVGTSNIYEFSNNDPLITGTYTIGSSGYFSTIKSAFDKLSTDGVAGNVTLELIDELYTAPTDSFGFKLNGPIPGAGPNSRVTIKPAQNKNVTLEGNGFVTLSCTNTSFVTIDGVDLTGTTTLTIHSLKNNNFAYNDGIDFLYDSDHNVLQNIIFIQEDNTRSSGSGFWCPQAGSAVPDSNIIQNNFVKQAGMAFFISTYLSSVGANGNIIRGNKIGSETDSLYSWGIQLEKCQNTIVENNIIQNQKVTRTSGSDIINVGINSYSGNGDIIRNNVVHNIKSTAGYTSVGILLSGGSGSNNMVYNNMIYDIQSASTQGNCRVAGIQIWNQTNPKIYYNTVYLTGNSNGANPLGSAALYIYGGFSGSAVVDLKNNIFINTRDESPYCASAIYDYNTFNLNSDYNDLYYDDTNPNNCLVRIAATNYHTLAEWQVLGKDSSSITEMPNFVAPYLHIAENEETLLESRGIPITDINFDFDGQTRHVSAPDIGADEFIGIPVGVEDETTLPTEFALEQNYPNPFNPSTKISWQLPVGSQQTLKIYDILGNEIATIVDEFKPAGRYEVEFNAASAAGGLPSGVYFYQLRAGEFVQTKKMLLLK